MRSVYNHPQQGVSMTALKKMVRYSVLNLNQGETKASIVIFSVDGTFFCQIITNGQRKIFQIPEHLATAILDVVTLNSGLTILKILEQIQT